MSGEAELIVVALVVILFIVVLYLANAAWNATTWFELAKPLTVALILNAGSFGSNKK